jgi:hypothetical protein
VGRKR